MTIERRAAEVLAKQIVDRRETVLGDGIDMRNPLQELEAIDARLVRIVEMRYFAGMTEADIATALGVTDRTIRRDWEKARLLLARALAS